MEAEAEREGGLAMDLPILVQSRLWTQGITQPVTAGTAAAAIDHESAGSGNRLKKERNSGVRYPRQGEEQVDISELARLLAKGAGARGGRL